MVSLNDLWNVITGLPDYIWGKITWLKDRIFERVKSLQDEYLDVWFPDVFDQITNTYEWTRQNLTGAVSSVVSQVGKWTDFRDGYFNQWFPDVFDQVTNTYEWTRGHLIDFRDELNRKLPDLETAIKGKVQDAINTTEAIITTAENGFDSLTNELKENLSENLGAITSGLGGSIDKLPGNLKKVFEGFGPNILTAINPLLGSLLTFTEKFGQKSDIEEDPALAMQLLDAFRKFENEAQFGEFHEIPHASMVDPEVAHEEAWRLRWSILAAKIALYAIGVVVEVASLGQVEGVTDAVRGIVEGSSWDRVASEVPMIEYRARLLKPLEYYYNREYTPNIPGASDLVRFRVREAILEDAFKKNLRLQGYSEEWAEAYWTAHWILPSPSQGYEMVARGEIGIEELRELLTVADYHPDWREQLMNIRYNLITRVDLRRLYQAGDIDFTEMTRRMQLTGFSEDDAPLVAKAQARQAQSEQVSLLITNLKNAYKAGWINNEDLEFSFDDMALPESQKLYHMEDAETDRLREEQEEFRDALRDGFRNDLITADEFYNRLLQIGMQEWKVSLYVGRELIRKGEWPFG